VTALLEVAQLTRRFGGLTAVDAVDMTVAPGEVRGLIGPNGAGKTTLLNLIGGQFPPSAGRITFAGVEITGMRSDRRAVLGVRRTFQNLKLFRDMTVLQNVMVGMHTETRAEVMAALLRTPRQRREETSMAERSMEALAIVGLDGQAEVMASSLAYGHRRLLEIARAIVSGPRLLLLDEPAAGLNPNEAADLVDLIRRINAEGIAVVLVEHHMDVVMNACSRITVLNYGRLLAEGTPDEVQSDAKVIESYLGASAAQAEHHV
jgi:branched-chain amino acid transport system ATP-binding protein